MVERKQPIIRPRKQREPIIRERVSVGRRLLPDDSTSLTTTVETSANGLSIDAGAHLGVTLRFGDRKGGSIEGYAGEFSLTPDDNGRIIARAFETLTVSWDSDPGATSLDVTLFTGIRVNPVETSVAVSGMGRRRDLTRGLAGVGVGSFTDLWNDFDLSFVSADDGGEVLALPVGGGYPGDRWRLGRLRADAAQRLVGAIQGSTNFIVFVSTVDGAGATIGLFQFPSVNRAGVAALGPWESVTFENRPPDGQFDSGQTGGYTVGGGSLLVPGGGLRIQVFSALAQDIQWTLSFLTGL